MGVTEPTDIATVCLLPTVFTRTQVNRMRELGIPGCEHLMVTHTDGKELFLWNTRTQPDRQPQVPPHSYTRVRVCALGLVRMLRAQSQSRMEGAQRALAESARQPALMRVSTDCAPTHILRLLFSSSSTCVASSHVSVSRGDDKRAPASCGALALFPAAGSWSEVSRGACLHGLLVGQCQQ